MTENPESSEEKNLATDCKEAAAHPLVASLLDEIGGTCPDAITQAPAEQLEKNLTNIQSSQAKNSKKPNKKKR